jgi:hypothetical protein
MNDKPVKPGQISNFFARLRSLDILRTIAILADEHVTILDLIHEPSASSDDDFLDHL